MKVGQTVTIEQDPAWFARVPVQSIRGDYVYLAPPHMTVRAFHRRTGRARGMAWRLAEKHRDPRAGRGTTR
jgi:hypothetical protein